jgi:predicted small lipoprotein YifL
MRTRASLLAAVIAAILALTACTRPGPTGAAPPAPRDMPERGGGDRGGGGMM